ncbi:S8 family serine peptidase [Chitinophaga niastensis]|uniref:S8 family serine peptidase n=1 Tax=Chitinophaga niastensis TaxID=536980 RepID=UPI001304A7AB|nr:S8 family serine peptidase [Chitinophaga niastensis]
MLLLCRNETAAQKKIYTDSLLLRYATDTFSRTHSTAPLLIKFTNAPTEKSLREWGLIKALTSHHYILRQLPTDSISLKKIVYCYTANTNWKATTLLLQQLEKLSDSDSITMQVSYGDLLQPLAYANIVTTLPHYAAAVVRIKKQDWTAFINQPAIRIADVLRHPSPEIIINTINPFVNRINIAQQQFPAIRGKNITVSVKEDLFDTTDIDLKGRYVPSPGVSSINSSHATIMATLIGGAGNSGSNGLGVAPEVLFSSADYNVSLFPDDNAYYRQYAITVQNHSYGTGIENYYGAEAAAYDQHVLEADTILHVFSSGNIGTQTSTSGRYQGIGGYANLSGNFKQAKNIIVTGGTDGAAQVMALSSKGPAYDGRIKPEIVVYGQDGTSGAAALTSGVAALLQDAWRQRFNTPASSALIKAIIINSASLPRGVLPGYDHGFGSLHALGALQTMQESRYRSGVVSPATPAAFDITIPAGMQQVKVTLCWNDPAAAVNAPSALVNDLDMVVTTSDNKQYLPWVLSSYPAADSLKMIARRGVDSLNNIEQISIDHPIAGKLHISIRGTRLSTQAQSFYLAYEFTPLQTFQWQNPVAGSILNASQNTPLQWQTSYSGNGDLSYSLDSGSTWLPVAQNIAIAQSMYNWPVPDIFHKILLKLTLTDTSFVSAPCYISPMLTIHTGFNCNDTALLYWNAQPGAAAYQVYTLGNSTLIPYSQPRDTFLFVPKAQVASLYFAVSPVAAAGWTGARSYAVNYTLQGVGCYIQNLLADKTTDNKVLLSLSLGSTYHLKNVYWERISGKNWATLSTQPVGDAMHFNYLDNSPWEGIVYYRVRLETIDGINIYSDPVSVQILFNNHILLFPNPVSTQLTILDTQIRSRKMLITDMNGRIVLQRALEDMQEVVSLQQLANGIYNCSIYLEGTRIYSKQFVKQQ